jgi:glycosyltransferase involved in cell wall biosynthesis
VRILIIYTWKKLWSMGTGKGSPDFYLSLKALAGSFERVVLVHPSGLESLVKEALPVGVEQVAFNWPGGGRLVTRPGWMRERARVCILIPRLALFALNWVLRVFSYLAFTVSAYRAAKRAAAESAPQVVAAYGYMAVPAAKLLSRKLRTPLVIRLFGVSLGMKGFSAFARLAQFEETLSFRIRAERWVITNDGSGGDRAARNLGVPADRVLYLLNGVDKSQPQEKFDRAAYRDKLGLPPETKIILRVARLWPQQRIDRLIALMPGVLPDGTPVAAVVAGEGSELTFLQSVAEERAVKVIFTGALTHSELGEHYSCADIYAATSDRTNLSNSVLEALNHGLPVVALATGGTGSVVRDMVNGRLVRFEQRHRLGEVLAETLGDEVLTARLSEGALRTAREIIPSYEERMRQEAEAFKMHTDFSSESGETG